MLGRLAVVVTMCAACSGGGGAPGDTGTGGGTPAAAAGGTGTAGGSATGGGSGGGSAGGVAQPTTERWDGGHPLHIIFLTSTKTDGKLGGLSGADSRCTSLAQAASLPGKFRAWLSTPGVNAIDHIAEFGPWYTRAGCSGCYVEVFANREALKGYASTSIDNDEKGGDHFSDGEAWTGTLTGGTTSAQTCLGWTSYNNDFGYLGDASNMYKWTWTNEGDFCSRQHRLICLQQP